MFGLSDRTDARSDEDRRLRLVVGVVACVGVLCIVGIVIMQYVVHVGRDTVGFEITKALIQVTTVSVVGAGIAALYTSYQRHRDRIQAVADQTAKEAKLQRDRRDDALRSLLDEAMEAYQSVKTVRRAWRTKLITSNPRRLPEREYEKSIGEVNAAQLKFEELKFSARTLDDPRIDSRELVASFRAVEVYLNALFYERATIAVHRERPDNPEIELSDGACLTGYLDSSRMRGDFKARVSRHIHVVQRLIECALLSSGTGPSPEWITIDRYLSRVNPPRDEAAVLRARIADATGDADGSEGIDRVLAFEELRRLQQRLSDLQSGVQPDDANFVAAARAYGFRRAIDPDSWRKAGVPDSVVERLVESPTGIDVTSTEYAPGG
jgi:hypothetical protein